MSLSGLKPLPASLAIAAFVALMTWIANSIHLPFVLFPELGALGLVIFSDPRHPWARSPVLLMLTPFLTGVLGLMLTREMDYGLVAVLLNVAGSLLLISGLRSPIAPALSAGLLPLVLEIRDWSYPFSILIGTGGLALVIMVRTHLHREHWKQDSPAEGQTMPPLRQWILPFGLFLLGGLALVQLTGSRLVLFPPLLVIAFETIVNRLHCPWRGRYGAVLLVANASALVGLILVKLLGVVPAASFLAVLATLALLHLTRLTFPPALGLALLPFVIPQPQLSYPLFTTIGSLWMILVVVFLEKLRRQ
jgi:hypothetical protein